MVTAAIHQPHYLPYPGLMDKIDSCDVFIWLDDAAFSRGGWHNRNRIKTNDGPRFLTVPVARHQHGPLSQTVPAGDAWRRRHRAALLQAYAHAPHRDTVREMAEDVLSVPHATLGALNLACCTLLARQMGIATPQILASSLGPVNERKTGRLVELCRRVGADTYLAGDGSAVYLDRGAFDGPVLLRWQNYRAPGYPQLHRQHGFVPNLSVVDLLANTGGQALALLRTARTVGSGAAA